MKHKLKLWQKILLTLTGVVALLLGYLTLKPSPYPALPYEKSDGSFNTQFQEPEKLTSIQYLDIAPYTKPEMVVVKNGWVYASVDGSKLIRLKEDGSQLEELFSTDGMLLGFEVDDKGDIYFADAAYQKGDGVLGVARQADGYKIDILADNYKGQAFGLVDAVKIAKNGDIYFTDAAAAIKTSEYNSDAGLVAIVDAVANTSSGTLYVYHPADDSVEKLVTGFKFANGMQLIDDERYLLVSDTLGRKMWKVDTRVRDAKLGYEGVTILLDDLVGTPDNMTETADGRFWVGLPEADTGIFDNLADKTLLRKMILNLPPQLLLSTHGSDGAAMAFLMTKDGKVDTYWKDDTVDFHSVTGVTETDDRYYFHHISPHSTIPYLEK